MNVPRLLPRTEPSRWYRRAARRGAGARSDRRLWLAGRRAPCRGGAGKMSAVAAPRTEDAHERVIVPIWSFPLFLVLYVITSCTIWWRYSKRRHEISELVEGGGDDGGQNEKSTPSNGDGSTVETDSPVAEDGDLGEGDPAATPNDADAGAQALRTAGQGGRRSPKKGGGGFGVALRKLRSSGATGPNLSGADQVVNISSDDEQQMTFEVEDRLGTKSDAREGASAMGVEALLTGANFGATNLVEITEASEAEEMDLDDMAGTLEEKRVEELRKGRCRVFFNRQLMLGQYWPLKQVMEVGVEAGIYLTTVQLLARFLFGCSFVFGAPLAWYYYDHGDRQNLDLASFTAANIPEGHEYTWITVLACCSLLMVMQSFSLFQWTRLQHLRYITPDAKMEAQKRSTLMILGFPRNICEDDELWGRMQQLLPGWLRGAHVALDLEELIAAERALALAKNQHASAVASLGTCSGRGRLRKAEKKLEQAQAKEQKIREEQLKGTGVAFLSFRSLQRALDFKGAMDRQALPIAYAASFDNPLQLATQPKKKEGFQPVEEAAGESGEKTVSDASSPLRGAVSLGKKAAKKLTPAPAMTATRFDDEVGERASCIEELGIRSWQIDFAPDPNDILWENLTCSEKQRQQRQQASKAIMIVMLAFGSAMVLIGVYTIGFHYVDLIYDIEPQAHVSNELDRLSEVFGGVYWLVFLAPPLIFLLMIAGVPTVSKMLLKMEKHVLRSAVLSSYVNKSFAFFLLLNLVLTSASWALIVANVNAIDQPIRIFADLSGTFHICIVLTECFVFVPMRMYRGWNLHHGHAVVTLTRFSLPSPALPFNPTLRDWEVDGHALLLFDFSKQYAELFSILAMVIAYAPIMPFVLPAGWLYFELMLFTDKEVLQTQFAKHRTEDRRVRTITRQMQLSMLAGQFVCVPFIVVHGTSGGAAAMIVIAVLTSLVFLLFLDREMHRDRAVYVAIEQCVRHNLGTQSARQGAAKLTKPHDEAAENTGGSMSMDYQQEDVGYSQLSLSSRSAPRDTPRAVGDGDDGAFSPEVRSGSPTDDGVSPSDVEPSSGRKRQISSLGGLMKIGGGSVNGKRDSRLAELDGQAENTPSKNDTETSPYTHPLARVLAKSGHSRLGRGPKKTSSGATNGFIMPDDWKAPPDAGSTAVAGEFNAFDQMMQQASVGTRDV